MEVFESRRVVKVIFDFGVVFCFDAGDELRIENDFQILLPSGQVIPISLRDIAQGAGHVLTRLHEMVELAEYADNGVFVLRFSDGVTMVISPDEAFEAWTFVGPNCQKIVCMPGGGVTEL